MGVLEEFDPLSLKEYFIENFKIYLFYLDLGIVYNTYCEQYSQNYDAYNKNDKARFTLDYTITRFLNIVINPTNAISSTETLVIAALINRIFTYISYSVTTLVAARGTKYKIQPGAYIGNSRIFTTIYKYYTYYKKDYYNNSEYIALYLYLKRRDNNSNNGSNSSSRSRGRGRSSRGGRGGRGGNNNNNNAPKDEPKPADAEAAAAFSFIVYAEQPTSTATYLIANSQSLQNRTSQAEPSYKIMAQTSLVLTATALLALQFIDSACTQHIVRDRLVFETLTPFALLAKVNGVVGYIIAEGVGRIRLQYKGLGGKRILVINNVQYVPISKFNLISQRQLEN